MRGQEGNGNIRLFGHEAPFRRFQWNFLDLNSFSLNNFCVAFDCFQPTEIRLFSTEKKWVKFLVYLDELIHFSLCVHLVCACGGL